MKYLKPPMLSMNFSENKEGMKKRISNILSTSRKYSGKICLGLLVFGVCVIGGLVGCSTKDVNEVDDTVRKTFTSAVLDGTEVITQMQVAAGLDTGKHSLLGCILSNNLTHFVHVPFLKAFQS